MKADGKYRFNLQFPAETKEQIQVGELLERAGNRKSAIVIDALCLYLQNHPELLSGEAKIVVHHASPHDKDQLEQMIRKVVKEYFQTEADYRDSVFPASQEADMDDDISQMLDNLDLFQ